MAMSEIIVERTATAHKVMTYAHDENGPISGLTVEFSVYDFAADEWLNMSDGSWQATKDVINMTEQIPGSYVHAADYTQTPATSDTLLALSEIVAGSAGVGRVDPNILRMVTSAKDIPGATSVKVWTELLAPLSATDNAAEQLLGAGGPATPNAVADAVLSKLVADYATADGSFGQVLQRLDSVALQALLLAALGKITRLGSAFKSLPCQDIFVGDIVPIRLPIIVDGELADLTGSTIVFNFTNVADGTRLTKTGLISGTPGHAEYITAASDGIVDAASKWRAQAVATLANLDVKASQIAIVDVQAVV